MTDRLTQLQEAVNCQAENLCNAIGVLQQSAPPSPFPEFERPAQDITNKEDKDKQQPPTQQQQQPPPPPPPPPAQPTEDYPQLFAQCIARTAKDIDVLIDSLPSEESSPELQAASLRLLEQNNQKSAIELEGVVKQCEELIAKVQLILKETAQKQLKINSSGSSTTTTTTTTTTIISNSSGAKS